MSNYRLSPRWVMMLALCLFRAGCVGGEDDADVNVPGTSSIVTL